MEIRLQVRMSSKDAHYGGNLVDGAKVMALFGDAATALLIKHDGDEGLFVAYENVEFKAPVFAGDFLEVVAKISHCGRTSRKIEFQAIKIVEARPDLRPSAADWLEQPYLVATAQGTCVVPKERQRKVNVIG